MINESYATTRQERRRKRRFPIQQEVEYRLFSGNRRVGVGRTINISSSGVLIDAQTTLPPRMPIELSIDWPALLNDLCPMKLLVFGRVVRTSERGTVIAIERHEFRTQFRALKQAAAVA
ncbi:MAG TPA: PilZ domain-containing protein [Terriglobales bacterium]|nr:PilZ domain-containing protein [Terriglobales bacterium]